MPRGGARERDDELRGRHRNARGSGAVFALIPGGRRYDVVVVDGSWRDECLRWALRHFADAPGVIIADNWQQDSVWISPEAEALMQPWPIHRFFQPGHVDHHGRPWNTAYWRIA